MAFQQKKRKLLVLTLHIAAWAVIFFVPLYLFSSDNKPDKIFIARIYLRTFIFALLFYVNYFFLIPWLLFKKKQLAYYLSASAFMIVLYFANTEANRIINESPIVQHQFEEFNKIKDEIKFMPKKPWRFDTYNFFFTAILITGFGIGLRMSVRYYENEKKHKELEKEMLNSELAFLKNQVSPHFFFNTLNNIYSLVEINTKDARKAILQLSKLMRYMLYESEQGNTRLSTEIEFMRNYIELMKLRLTEKVSLLVNFPDQFDDINIPPLLFIPFIENAFKHGISYRDNSFIMIDIVANSNNITFICKNSLGISKDVVKENSGIGLENVKKRLALLFPEKYKLSIKQDETTFSVFLKIDL
ncbi:MAG: histidine kinase [Bacteroidales bacterium]|nr:histidine kinase [Bacteroidales bacterium]